MSTESPASRTNDDVFQPGRPVPESHPDRLASVATLFGMRPQPIDHCRVLEMGCGPGRNLLPMADRHPESTFIGIDQAGPQLAAASKAASELGLANVRFEGWEFADADESLGKFDYIICNDLFSRVAPELADSLLAICQAHLAPQGVAYFSYRTYPGWMLAQVVRELLRPAATEGDTIQIRLARARTILQFVSASLAADRSTYGHMLKSEADLALQMPDPTLVCEYLGAQNHPVYLHEFAARAARHELQYLGDARVGTMFATLLERTIQHSLVQVASDALSAEQHLDLLRNRATHRSLLCHEDVTIAHELAAERLRGLFLAGDVHADGETANLESDDVSRFVTRSGAAISTKLPAFKAALAELGQAWPRAIAFDELIETVMARLPKDEAAHDERRTQLARNLVECVANGLLDVRSEAGRFVATASERPRAANWARAEAEFDKFVTNRSHEPVTLDEMSQNLLRHLDGQRDRAALLKILVQAAETGHLSILRGDMPASESETTAQILDQVLDQSLARLAGARLLVA